MGNPRGSNRQMIPASAPNTRNRPSVMITSGRWSDGSNGRISTRSITAPIAALISMPTTTASHIGSPRSVASTSTMKAPNIAISPWAKLISVVAL